MKRSLRLKKISTCDQYKVDLIWLFYLLYNYLEARGSWFAGWYVSLVVDSKFRHHGDDSLDDKGDDVRPHPLDVDTFSC